MEAEALWRAFQSAAGLAGDATYLESFHFDVTQRAANELLALVLSGRKRATASARFAYAADGSDMPRVGDYSIVTDWDGDARCVIRTTAVTVVPFDQMTFAVCSREGEDETLESWQANHRRFFAAEGADMGYAFAEDMPVVFEDFEVVYTA